MLLPPYQVPFDECVRFYRDTVNSVGIISRHLPFTQSNTAVKTFRHAVSLDERRAKFKANLYHRSSEKDLALGTNPGEVPKSVPNTSNPNVDGRRHVDSNIKTPKGEGGSKKKCKVSGRECQRELEMKFSKSEPTILVTDVKEVWFAGCHAGGSLIPCIMRRTLKVYHLNPQTLAAVR